MTTYSLNPNFEKPEALSKFASVYVQPSYLE